MKSKPLRVIFDLLIVTVGATIFAAAVSLVLEPFNLVPGGITGIAMLIYSKWQGLPLGTIALLMNVPLLILSFIFLGRKFLFYTAYGTIVSALMINVTSRFEPWMSPETTDDVMLVAIAGGVLMGVGLGLVFMRGATTGGSDIVARLLKLIFPHVQIGKIMFAFDGCLVLTSMLVFGNVWVGLYATIGLFICAQVMDAILYGLATERVAYIISDQYEEIAKVIDKQLSRGCTFLHGEGSYSGASRKVILCAVKRQQISLLKSIVKDTDPNAFLILSEANEVLGEGFRVYDKHGL